MAITRGTMTDEQRKSVAIEYLKAFDNKGLTSSGASMLDLFASDAQVFITGTDVPTMLVTSEATVFHVEHGCVVQDVAPRPVEN